MRKLYCVKYGKKIKPYYGYIRPWNSVRDIETWSLTYLTPSFINGIEEALSIKSKIVRHKLTFDEGMTKDFSKSVVYLKNNKKSHTIHNRHILRNPELTLAFDNEEDAKVAFNLPLYMGQNIYPIYPSYEYGIKVMTDDEFDLVGGVETFETTKDDEMCVYVGNNRYRNNERMYVNVIRKPWV